VRRWAKGADQVTALIEALVKATAENAYRSALALGEAEPVA
jgi:hypothetical protein